MGYDSQKLFVAGIGAFVGLCILGSLNVYYGTTADPVAECFARGANATVTAAMRAAPPPTYGAIGWDLPRGMVIQGATEIAAGVWALVTVLLAFTSFTIWGEGVSQSVTTCAFIVGWLLDLLLGCWWIIVSICLLFGTTWYACAHDAPYIKMAFASFFLSVGASLASAASKTQKK